MTTIQTTHAGSLPRSPELIEANAARPVGEDGLTPQPTEEFREVLRQAVVDVVAKQREIGISVPNDGEYGHLMGSAVNYGRSEERRVGKGGRSERWVHDGKMRVE